MSTQQIFADAMRLPDPEKVELIAKLEETLHLPAEIDLAQRKEAMSRLDKLRKSALNLSTSETVVEFTGNS